MRNLNSKLLIIFSFSLLAAMFAWAACGSDPTGSVPGPNDYEQVIGQLTGLDGCADARDCTSIRYSCYDYPVAAAHLGQAQELVNAAISPAAVVDLCRFAYTCRALTCSGGECRFEEELLDPLTAEGDAGVVCGNPANYPEG